ncbi:MAG: CHAP domain-containing protein, partial [Armatimonadota bacterium]|nr:CHAP domain-containing protein [Armatimonadota bacterium]
MLGFLNSPQYLSASYRKLLFAFAVTSIASLTMPQIAAAERPILVSGNQWLNGQGVDAYDNGTNIDNVWGRNYVNGIDVGLKWQCVELAQRLYTIKGWHSGKFPGVASAYQIYDVAPNMGMERHDNNGSGYVPVPGDMVVYAKASTAGHVSVVDRVDDNSVYVVEQNWPYSGDRFTHSRSGPNSSILSSRSGYTVRGIVHDPDNSSGGTDCGTGKKSDGSTDNAIVDAYNRNGGRAEVGEPTEYGGGKCVHEWGPGNSGWIQDFDHGNFGRGMITRKKDQGTAYSIHGTIFNKWLNTDVGGT